MEMGAADADKHTDSNRNDDGSDIVHGTLEKAEIGFGESSPHSSFLQKTNRARWNRYLYLAIEYFIKNIYTIVPFEKEWYKQMLNPIKIMRMT